MFLVARLLIRNSNIMKAYEDHDRQEQVVRQSALDWTIVRPVMLNDKATIPVAPVMMTFSLFIAL